VAWVSFLQVVWRGSPALVWFDLGREDDRVPFSAVQWKVLGQQQACTWSSHHLPQLLIPLCPAERGMSLNIGLSTE
jgi:hypothetical protein